MKIFLNIIFIVIIILLVFKNKTYSQDCSDYYKKCENADKSYTASGMSRGIKLTKGSTYELNLTIYANRDYFISFEGEKSLGDIQFVILDSENQILYNNSVDEFKQFTNIITDVTTQLKIQLITQPDVYKPNSTTKYCAGIFVAYKKK